MIRKESNCMGCETCQYSACRYFKDEYITLCDECEEVADRFIEVDGLYLCFDCFKKSLKTETGYCDDCEMEDTLYNPEQGVWLCEECLEEYFDNRCITDEQYIGRMI